MTATSLWWRAIVTRGGGGGGGQQISGGTGSVGCAQSYDIWEQLPVIAIAIAVCALLCSALLCSDLTSSPGISCGCCCCQCWMQMPAAFGGSISIISYACQCSHPLPPLSSCHIPISTPIPIPISIPIPILIPQRLPSLVASEPQKCRCLSQLPSRQVRGEGAERGAEGEGLGLVYKIWMNFIQNCCAIKMQSAMDG